MPHDLDLFSRRDALAAFAAGAGAAGARSSWAAARATVNNSKAHGLKQSVCRWPYAATPLPEFCRRVRHIGFSAIDLLFPDEWHVAQDAGITVSMGYASRRDAFIQTGFNDPAHHALLLTELEAALPLAARAGVANVIAMFGNRVPGIDDSAAIANCVAGLSKIAPVAVKQGVTICVELLNSKVDHKVIRGITRHSVSRS